MGNVCVAGVAQCYNTEWEGMDRNRFQLLRVAAPAHDFEGRNPEIILDDNAERIWFQCRASKTKRGGKLVVEVAATQ